MLLVHPGGPFWKNKDLGVWSIPKGEIEPEESSFAAAQREFEEETGVKPQGEFIPLGKIRQAAGKVVQAWAVAGNCDSLAIRSNPFTMIWPPNSGNLQTFLEVDRAEWFPLNVARKRILRDQAPLLERLANVLEARSAKAPGLGPEGK